MGKKNYFPFYLYIYKENVGLSNIIKVIIGGIYYEKNYTIINVICD